MDRCLSQAARGLFSCVRRAPRARGWLLTIAACAGFATCIPATANAGTVHLTWDANVETDLVGYVILYRSEDGSPGGSLRVPLTPTSADVPNLRNGVRYFFSVSALNAAGQSSLPSSEVSGIVGGAVDPTGQPAPTPVDGGVNTYFAEGAASDLFKYRLALLNTTALDTQAVVTFLREGDTPVARGYPLPAFSRFTVSASDIPELNGRSFGAIVNALPGVVAERTMSWDSGGDMSDATTAKALVAPSTTWYLAEGNAGFFDTFILLVNPSTTAAANASIDFLTQDGHVEHIDRQLAPSQRVTVYVNNDVPALTMQSFGTTIHSDTPILVERAMYFRNGEPMFVGGAASGAVPEGAPHWFLAEGQSGGFFSTYVLVSNPNSTPVDLDVRFLTAAGVARQDHLTLAATSRLTLNLNDYPELANSDVSTDISASGPVIAERTMYWPNNPGPWYGSHNSAGLTELSTKWGLAEGEVGGATGAKTYVLLANPGSASADVTLTFYRENGLPGLSLARTVPAGSRVTVDCGDAGLGDGERFGVAIFSGQPIAVERSVYWNTGGILWGSGSNEQGTKLP
jgi:hypothetical protein